MEDFFPRDFHFSIFPTKNLSSHHETILEQIESIERKAFPKNEVMPIKDEITKKSNTMLIAYYYEEPNQKLNKRENNNITRKNLSRKQQANNNNIRESQKIKIAGYIIYSLLYSAHSLPITRIIKLCIHTSLRKKGLGTRLLEMCLGRTGVPEKSRAELHVDVQRKDAINLYRKVGFEIYGDLLENYYEIGRDAWFMVLVK
ncbi:4963_t:CDS:1 [Ambispora gerdemannii]|uniref:4963_t:CDS:1 n=1 Tax=Ambispora gerdemannii TaxID=144530 RepID=A0A9N9A0F0_9GLOM|nr:4963_t:CDS:1 [Ambispora gerdemannii]